MEGAAGSVDVAFGEMTEGVNASKFALDQYKQRFVVWAQDAGQAIIDFSGPLATGLLGVAEFGGAMAMMAPQITAAAVALRGSRLATMAATTAQTALNLAMSLNPIGLIIAALVAVGLAIWVFRDEIKEGFGQVVKFAKNLYEGVQERGSPTSSVPCSTA